MVRGSAGFVVAVPAGTMCQVRHEVGRRDRRVDGAAGGRLRLPGWALRMFAHR